MATMKGADKQAKKKRNDYSQAKSTKGENTKVFAEMANQMPELNAYKQAIKEHYGDKIDDESAEVIAVLSFGNQSGNRALINDLYRKLGNGDVTAGYDKVSKIVSNLQGLEGKGGEASASGGETPTDEMMAFEKQEGGDIPSVDLFRKENIILPPWRLSKKSVTIVPKEPRILSEEEVRRKQYLDRLEKSKRRDAIIIDVLGKIPKNIPKDKIYAYETEFGSEVILPMDEEEKQKGGSVVANDKLKQKDKNMYKTGGKLYGKSHQQGGIPAVDATTGEQVAEVEGGERIFSREDTMALEGKVAELVQAQDSKQQDQIAMEIGYMVAQMIMQQNENQGIDTTGAEAMPADQAQMPPMAQKGKKLLELLNQY